MKIYVVTYYDSLNGEVVVDSVYRNKAWAHERANSLVGKANKEDVSCQALELEDE